MKRQALVVGINRYPFLKDSLNNPRHLTTSDRDASAIAYFLERYGSFEVTRFPFQDVWEVDPVGLVTVDNLKTEIIRLFQPKVNVPETALLFFAGRGLRQENQDGTTEGFLGTSDTNTRKNRWGISLNWLRQLLRDSLVQQQIIWLDSSFSGELFNFSEVVDTNKHRCFITATQEFENAYVFDGPGLLTRAILESLDPTKQSNAIVTNLTLTDSINRQFKAQTVQRPICYNTDTQINFTSIISFSHKKTEHSLQRLWRETEEWFCDDHPLIKHSPSKIFQYFSQQNPNQDKANRYREAVENALGGAQFPDSWWLPESVEHIHECMKTLCGEFFNGSDKKLANKKHISVGAAYLIALMAYQEVSPNKVQPLTNKVKDWIGREKSSTSRLFPLQDAETTKASAMALYDLFYCLFDPTKKDSQVINALFDPPGNFLKIEFNWLANQPTEEGGKSLSDLTYELWKNEIFIPEKGKTTTNAILRLLGSMFVSKAGFSSPGVVYMESNALVIASTT